MAAFVKAVNAKIRSNPVTDYVCSTRTLSILPAAVYAAVGLPPILPELRSWSCPLSLVMLFTGP